jgi:putative ABC transport system permease protein
MSYVVRQRTAEIGTRIALGARPADVIRTITGQGMRWTFVGLAVGLVASYLVTRLLTGLLYGVEATDAVALVGIAAVLTTTAYLACYLPARRASRIDPLLALRSE